MTTVKTHLLDPDRSCRIEKTCQWNQPTYLTGGIMVEVIEHWTRTRKIQSHQESSFSQTLRTESVVK